MLDFFAALYQGGAFELFGATHFAALGALIVLNIFLLSFKNASDGTKSAIRWTLALILLVNEIAWHYWNYAVGKWTIQTMLPLHLCSLLVWLGALMLMTKNYRIYEFMYFMGIAGAIQALATPGLGIYGFFSPFCLLPIFHFPRIDHYLCHLHDRCGGIQAHLEILGASGDLDEYLRDHCLLHQCSHPQ